MSKFLNKLRTEQDEDKHMLLSTLAYQDDVHGEINVPEGFISDYVTLSMFKNIFLFTIYAMLINYGNRAAVIHDYLYTVATLTRVEADDVFYRALRADGVAKWRALILWTGVRIGGKWYYNEE